MLQNIFVIRHAEGIIGRDVRGRLVDEKLSNRGEAQAHQIAARLHELMNPDQLYIAVSGAKRAVDTAQIISNDMHVPYTVVQYLNLNTSSFISSLEVLITLREYLTFHGIALITHRGFLDAAISQANRKFNFPYDPSKGFDLPFGSILHLDLSEQSIQLDKTASITD